MIGRYARWLHTQWPAGSVERLPDVRPDSSTNVPGLYVVGDLKGVPLLKFAVDSGARAVRTIADDPAFARRNTDDERVLDLVIVGGGVAGFAAALEARKQGLRFELLEASEPFSTIVNFPKGKPIFTYPPDMTAAGDLSFHEISGVKEGLLEDLHNQTTRLGLEPRIARVERVTRRGSIFEVHIIDGDTVRAHRVIVAVGRSGNFRKLGVTGEGLDKVYNRLHDPADFCGQNVLIVGGGDSALESAIALAGCGARVTISYRRPEFSRPKPENVRGIRELSANPDARVQVEQPSSERVTTAAGDFMGAGRTGSLRMMMASHVEGISEREVVIKTEQGQTETLPNDAVFAMIGRDPPLGFFRRSGVRIRGEWRVKTYVSFFAFLAFCICLYLWKAGTISQPDPGRLWTWLSSKSDALAGMLDNPSHLLGTLRKSASSPSFFYTLAYSALVVVFGIRRMRRSRTPYVTAQTLTFTAIQCLPLFLLPEILLPWAGHNGWFDGGWLGWIADQLFPAVGVIDREYWRAYGFVLAWPLFIGNLFTGEPMWAWLVIGFVQTFVAIPVLVYYWGKGAYCGWICPCGALAETLGDVHRHKMPHGPIWNRLNMVGQVILWIALLMLLIRVIGWVWPGSVFASLFNTLLAGNGFLNYKWIVDITLAGIVGVACYFWFSGRVWCRFACPLAALMHIYARFTRFRIIPDKKKCISCNVCTSVCHQGIDIMNFANKGLPMADPQCVRCSACVQQCPTNVLAFGQVDPRTGQVLRKDPPWLAASHLQMVELKMPK